MADAWDELDKQYGGGAAASPSADPWAELDAAHVKRYQSAPSEAPTIQPVSQLPKMAAGQPLGRFDKVVQGMRDPIDGGAQLLTNMLPNGLVNSVNKANNWLADNTGMVGRIPDGGIDKQIRDNEAAYKARRDQAGETGFDGYRMIGNVLSPANTALAARAPQAATLAGRIGVGMGMGGASGAMAPVTEGDYSSEKLKQIGVGGATGGLVPAITGAASRIISPNASTNPNLQLLRKEGVTPTIGQSLGGWANSLEEKMTSLPIMGDAIGAARRRSLEQFNTAALNRAAGKIGQTADGIGQGGVLNVGNKISGAYDDALSSLGPVQFDNQFSQQSGQLQGMAQNLIPAMRDKFNAAYKDVVVGRMSPNGTMLPETFKKVDSELGGMAARYGKSSVASEQEFGDSIKQLQQILKEQAGRSDPAAAAKLKAADSAYANLVRVEGAAKAAKNNDGIFTPAQLNQSIQAADGSVRKRAVSRGTALMQDLGNAGQQVIGNKVPNSFTTDRALIAGGGLGSYMINPAIPAGLLGGAALYSKAGQALLSGAASVRPKSAKAIADALDKRAAYAIPFGAQFGLGLLN